jgi:Rps23 Pro-64 3,4-dihydroxylase Tpa1-like proline 4-hydroxylase
MSLFKAETEPAFGFEKNLLDHEHLMQIATDQATAYGKATPFPHAIIDGFLSPLHARRLAQEFPKLDATRGWLDFNGTDPRGKPVQVNKYHISDEDRMGPITQRLLYELKSQKFIAILERLTGISDLIPDALNLGGGIHLNASGALLKIHADFNRHDRWHLDRRLNLLLYLNEDWRPDYGGDLELWDQDMTRCVKRISPIAGRCVIFSTSSHSFHGHPEPIACPPDVSRKSVALYYYTNGVDSSSGTAHSTLWQSRPHTDD